LQNSQFETMLQLFFPLPTAWFHHHYSFRSW
jgi:hypothetical protein